MPKGFYTYIWLRENGTPYYVGNCLSNNKISRLSGFGLAWTGAFTPVLATLKEALCQSIIRSLCQLHPAQRSESGQFASMFTEVYTGVNAFAGDRLKSKLVLLRMECVKRAIVVPRDYLKERRLLTICTERIGAMLKKVIESFY
jgi:hypothetical protein